MIWLWRKNILEADGTIIFSRGALTGGSLLTRKLIKKLNKPWVHLDPDQMKEWIAADIIAGWIDRHGIQILSVAGPRATNAPELLDIVVEILEIVVKV